MVAKWALIMVGSVQTGLQKMVMILLKNLPKLGIEKDLGLKELKRNV